VRDRPFGPDRKLLLARTAWLIVAWASALAGCQDIREGPADDRIAQTDRVVQAKWGKPLADLPTVRLVAISPHNENIQKEFEQAFTLHHAREFGQRVHIQWHDVGGGGNAIGKYLRNVYAHSDTSKIDVLWGGGDFMFAPIAEEGLLEPMALSADVLANIPAEVGGIRMYDEKFRWCGSAVSGFGFIYNAGMLERCNIAPPQRWDDLGDARFAGLIALADPTQSGSAAVSYLMIVQSAPTWADGWAKLLGVLGNAKRFADSAGSAANGPALGEALVATCIDFYGILRVAEAPDELVYLSPPGQTIYSPDPIGILKGPPNRELAERFVAFVLSRRGQALWALPPGHPDGPARSLLGRQPIRRDVYDTYAGQMSPRIANFYRAGASLKPNEAMNKAGLYSVLKQLVRTAAVDNRNTLRAARRRLHELAADPAAQAEYDRRTADFVRLPDNVATLDDVARIRKQLKDPVQAELILTAWQDFFRSTYKRVAR
jgi:iron(III) transport system substrate-binding protein